MKIFAYNLCLDFAPLAYSQRYDFSPISFSTFLYRLEKGPDFSGQVFYIAAEASNAFVTQLYDFQAMEKWRSLLLTIHLVFPDEETRQVAIDAFGRRFRQKKAAGGIVQNEQAEYLFIFNRERWSFAKGGVEKGEKIKDAAVREVQEETGLDHLEVTSKLPSTFHTFLGKKGWVLKETYWYRMKTAGEQPITPQLEEGITAVRWFSKPEWITQNPPTYPLIQELIQQEFIRTN